MVNSSSSSPEWDSRTKRTVAVLLLLAGVVLVWFVRDILPLLIVSALLAFVFNPMATFITRRIFRSRDGRGARRGLAAFVTFLFGIILLIIAGFVVIPSVISQLEDFGSRIPSRLEGFEDEIEMLLSQPITFNNEPILINGEEVVPLRQLQEITGIESDDLSEILQLDSLDLQRAAQAFLGQAGSLTGTAFGFLGSAFNTVINITLLLVMTFYLLKDGARFSDSIVTLAPEGYQEDTRRLLDELTHVWNAYIRGQLILCVVMGFAVYIAALALGLPNAPILGLLAGLLEFIPNIGPLIALVPAAFLALVSESTTIGLAGQPLAGLPFAIVVIIVWTGLQNLEAILLVPRIMGESLDLHPFAVIIGVLGGAAFAGALGVILAAPMLASGRVIVRYAYGKLTNREPFTPNELDEVSYRPTFLSRLFARLWQFVRNQREKRQSGMEDSTTKEATQE